MSKYGVFCFSKDSFIMETDKSIEIADLHVRFNAYGSTIDVEGEEKEEIVEEEEVDDRLGEPFDIHSNCLKLFPPVNFWHKSFLFAWCCRRYVIVKMKY